MISRVLILISLVCLVQAWTDKEMEDFKGFMNKYRLHYSNETEEFDHRIKAFKDNMKVIDDINKGKGHGGQYGVNKFSAMTLEEFKQMLLPTTFDPKKHQNRIPKTKADHHSRHKRQLMPTSFDYRDVGWVTPVKDQGSCDAVFAFVATAIVESNLLSYKGIFADLSEQSLMDCDVLTFGCQGGWLEYPLDYIRKYGVSSETDYPYVGAQSNGTCLNVNKVVYENSDFWFLESETEVADYVYYHGPVAFYFGVPSAFQYYTGGVFDVASCDDVVGYHQVTVVGYTPDYWIVKNSWGTDWGDNGYVYYKRGKNLCWMESELVASCCA